MLRRQFKVQCRIIGALLIREIVALYGRDGLGAGWVVAEPLTFALPVLTLWYFTRAPFQQGIPLIPFLWTGYLPILLFRHIGGAMLHFIRGNTGLLYHRQVTIFDIFIARCVFQVGQNVAAATVVYAIFYLVGIIDAPRDFPMLMVGYFFMVWWCVVNGLFLGALSERAEWVDKVWNTYAYTYIFYSGFWFMAAWLPPNLRAIALLQPSLQAYEMLRAGVLGDTVTTFYNIGYTTFALAIMTWAGLLALRAGRKHVSIA